MKFSSDEERREFIKMAAREMLDREPRPAVVLIMAESESVARQMQRQGTPVVPVDENGVPGEMALVTHFDTLEEFEQTALANDDLQAIQRVHEAMRDRPGQLVIYTQYDGGSDVSVMRRIRP